jgi:hypothetical protein
MSASVPNGLHRTPKNYVHVTVSSNVQDAQDAFDKRYGNGATLAEEGRVEFTGGATNIQDSAPFRGGQHIRNIDKNNYGCTSGFIGYRNTVPTTYFVLTAGHCGAQNHIIYQVNRSLGRVNLRAAGENSVADAARLLFTPIVNGVEQRSNQWRVTNSSGYRYDHVGYEQSSVSDQEGQAVCHTGITTGYTCGILDNRDYAYSGTDVFGVYSSFPHGRVASYDCNPGDSGGPVFYQGGAMGISSAKEVRSFGNDYCIYGQIGDVRRAVDVHGLLR